MLDRSFETGPDGLGRDPGTIACLERTRSAVLNVLVAVGSGIAASGLILGRHEAGGPLPWDAARTQRAAFAALIGLIAFAYMILRVGSGRDALRDPIERASRFTRSRVAAALIAALAVPLGFAYGWFADPRLEALAPFWVAALGLGFLALPRGHELDGLDGPPGES